MAIEMVDDSYWLTENAVDSETKRTHNKAGLYLCCDCSALKKMFKH
jgi:hypothetical protein